MDFPPDQIASSFAWRGTQMQAQPERWLHHLTAEECTALYTVSKAYADSGRALSEMRQSDVPLPTWQPRLRALSQCLRAGDGVRVLRGLDLSQMSDAQAGVAFYALGLHLGCPRVQNAAGHLLGHVRDVGASASDTSKRIYQTAQRQTFHTDSADVVGLLCLRNAKSGGDSLVVSSVTIYNEMMRRAPDLARLLFAPIATDRRGEIPPGAKPFFEIPVFNWYHNALTGIYQRQYIDSAQRFDAAPRLSAAHIQALDLFDALSNDPSLHFGMRLQPGDLQFVYNHALLHDRTAFEDHPEPERKRYLYRLWLAMPEDRPLPPCFAQRFGQTTVGARGGVVV